MREILFRGRQSGGSGEWIDGGIWIEDNKYYIVGKVRYFPDTRDWNTLEYYEDNPVYRYGKILVDPETVCQYTGFKDKNGNKIFEGDIVSCYAGVENRSVVFDENMGAFEFDNNDPHLKRITISTVQPGEARLRAEVRIDYENMMRCPESARDYALRELRNQLADGLLAYMKITTYEDFSINFNSRKEIIRGEVRVIDPMFEDHW